MLVHVFIDKIYLYDDHFIIYFNHINKTSSISQNDVKKVEEYFSYSCSNTEECSVPINRGLIVTLYFHVDKKMVPQKWLFLVVRYPGNHEFPDHEKNGLDLDFLLLTSCAFLHEFPFFKIKQHAGNCFTKYLQPRGKQFLDKQFLCLLRNHNG